MAQEELQESKLTKAGGRKPTHGCNYPMVGWPSVILTPMGPSLNLTREGTSRPSLRSSLSLCLLFHALLGSRASRGSTCPLHVSYPRLAGLQSLSGFHLPLLCLLLHALLGSRASRGSTCPLYVSCSTPCWVPEPLGVPLSLSMSLTPCPAGLPKPLGVPLALSISLIPCPAGLPEPLGVPLALSMSLIHALLDSRASRGSTCPCCASYCMPCWAPEPLAVPLALSMSLTPHLAGLQSL